MPQIDIKSYSDNEKDGVIKLILEIQQMEFGVSITLNDQPDLENIASFYQIRNGNFWVAKVNNHVVGTIALLDIGAKQGALRKMFVKKEFRGKEWGIGQLLLSALLKWSREKGLAKVFLGTTEKFIAAQRFYEKNGFSEIAKHKLPDQFPVMHVDVKFYEYDLNLVIATDQSK